MSAPCIVSNVHPYKDLPVLYVDEPWQWYQYAKLLAANPGLRQEYGEQLREYCARVFNFDRINLMRKQIFESLCGSLTTEEAVKIVNDFEEQYKKHHRRS